MKAQRMRLYIKGRMTSDGRVTSIRGIVSNGGFTSMKNHLQMEDFSPTQDCFTEVLTQMEAHKRIYQEA